MHKLPSDELAKVFERTLLPLILFWLGLLRHAPVRLRFMLEGTVLSQVSAAQGGLPYHVYWEQAPPILLLQSFCSVARSEDHWIVVVLCMICSSLVHA